MEFLKDATVYEGEKVFIERIMFIVGVVSQQGTAYFKDEKNISLEYKDAMIFESREEAENFAQNKPKLLGEYFFILEVVRSSLYPEG